MKKNTVSFPKDDTMIQFEDNAPKVKSKTTKSKGRKNR